LITAGVQAQVVVIVHSDVTGDHISKDALAKVFTGSATRIPSGARVIPVMLKNGPVHSEFATDFLGRSPVSLMVIWRGLVLSGQSAMPKAFDSEDEMVKFVAKTPGAIGYIGVKTPHDDVKVLEVR